MRSLRTGLHLSDPVLEFLTPFFNWLLRSYTAGSLRDPSPSGYDAPVGSPWPCRAETAFRPRGRVVVPLGGRRNPVPRRIRVSVRQPAPPPAGAAAVATL